MSLSNPTCPTSTQLTPCSHVCGRYRLYRLYLLYPNNSQTFPNTFDLTRYTMAPKTSNYPLGPYPAGEHIIPPPRSASPATAEYRLNHLMLRIKNPEKSLRFYCDCMGMHVVFIFNAGPWTIYYLGPRDVGRSTKLYKSDTAC
jgi:hypothetical protein